MKKRQHNLWLGTVGLATVLIACTQLKPETINAQNLDGRWDVTHIDGQDVSGEGYRVVFEQGRIMGGYDGCNHWGRQLHEGRWLVVSTLIGCPDKPGRNGYDAVMATEEGLRVRSSEHGTLAATHGGHELILRRGHGVAN